MGEGFRAESSGGTVPTWCIVPARRNVVMVVTPDGDTHRFEARLVDNCEAFQPPDFVSLDFQPLPGTTSTLEAQGNNQALWVQGELLDENGQVLDPRAYVLTLADGRELYFDQFTGFQQIKDLNGNTVVFGTTGIQHSSGRSIIFQRDTQGRITRITDPDGKFIQYSYDLDGNLSKVTDRGGHQTRLTYYTPTRIHHLRDIIDPRGIRAIRNDYDAAGRLLSTTDSLGRSTSFGYDIETRRQTITDRLGNIRTLEYNAEGFVTRETDQEGAVTTRTFDDNGNQLSEIDPTGRTRSWTYNSKNNVLSETDPDGKTTTHTYGPFSRRLTTTNPLGNTTTKVYEQGNLKSVQGPIPGDITRFGHDSRGNLTEHRDALGHLTQFAYDSSGNQTSETDPLGKVRTRTYDSNGRMLTETRIRTVNGNPESLTMSHQYDSTGRETRTTYPDGSTTSRSYDAAGNVLAETDQLARTTRSAFDTLGRLSRNDYADGTSESFTYDAEGRQLTRRDRAGRTTAFGYDKTGRPTRITYPDESFDARTYDGAGRVLTSMSPASGTTTFTYDAAGRRATETDALGAVQSWTYDAAGRQISTVDKRGYQSQFYYDPQGRQTRTVWHDGNARRIEYDLLGQVTAEVDEEDRRTEFAFDALGRLLSVTDPLSQLTLFSYDEVGNRIAATDPLGHATAFAYDAFGRETRRTLVDGAFEAREYDAAGNVIAKTDFRGHRVTSSYDTNGRLIRKDYPSGPAATFTYNSDGHRLTATDARGTTTYEYELSRGRLFRKNDPSGWSLQYVWDAAGRPTAIGTMPTNGISPMNTTYTYDVAGRLQSVQDSDAHIFSVSHDAEGNLALLARPNGVETKWTYDSRNRLTEVRTFRAVDNATIARYAYGLSASGQHASILEADGTNRSYGYDASSRLTSETITGGSGPSYAKTFAYDAASNRTSQATTGFGAGSISSQYDSRQRLTAENGAGYTWDANGNQLSNPAGDTFVWDFDDRLVRVVRADGTRIDNVYDVDSVLVQATVTPQFGTPGTTHYLVDTTGARSHVVAEVAGQSQVTYVRAGETLLAELRNGNVRYFEIEGIGSVRSLLDSSGIPTDSWRYSAFGELLTRTGTSTQPYQFAGERFVVGLGLYQNRARWLDVGRGAFVSMDPLVRFTRQPYAYAANDPAWMVDPDGLSPFSIGGFLTSLAVRASLFTIQHPTLTAIGGIVLSAALPTDVSESLSASGIPGLQQIGYVGRARARVFRLIKSPAVVKAIERYIEKKIKGGFYYDVGHAFEDMLFEHVFKGAQRALPVGAGKHTADFLHRGVIVEVKSGVEFSRAQLREIAAEARNRAVSFAYIYLRKPSDKVVRAIQRAGGTVTYVFDD